MVTIDHGIARSNERPTFFSLHVRSADQLPNLPSGITFEICTSSSSPSPPAPVTSISSSISSSVTHSVAEDTFGADDSSTFIKTERVVSGVHFLTDREEDRAEHLLLPKAEVGENEPEVRKQVGCYRHDFLDPQKGLMSN